MCLLEGLQLIIVKQYKHNNFVQANKKVVKALTVRKKYDIKLIDV